MKGLVDRWLQIGATVAQELHHEWVYANLLLESVMHKRAAGDLKETFQRAFQSPFGGKAEIMQFQSVQLVTIVFKLADALFIKRPVDCWFPTPHTHSKRKRWVSCMCSAAWHQLCRSLGLLRMERCVYLPLVWTLAGISCAFRQVHAGLHLSGVRGGVCVRVCECECTNCKNEL